MACFAGGGLERHSDWENCCALQMYLETVRRGALAVLAVLCGFRRADQAPRRGHDRRAGGLQPARPSSWDAPAKTSARTEGVRRRGVEEDVIHDAFESAPPPVHFRGRGDLPVRCWPPEATRRCGVALQRRARARGRRLAGRRLRERPKRRVRALRADRRRRGDADDADHAAERERRRAGGELADKIGVEAAELEAELVECWRGAVTPVRKPKRKPRLVRPRAPEAEGAPWTVDVTCPWCENPISLALEGAVDRWAKKRPIKCMMDGQQDLHLVGKDRPKRSRKCPGFVLERAKAADDGSPQLEVKSAPMPLDGPCALAAARSSASTSRRARARGHAPLRGDLRRARRRRRPRPSPEPRARSRAPSPISAVQRDLP